MLSMESILFLGEDARLNNQFFQFRDVAVEAKGIFWPPGCRVCGDLAQHPLGAYEGGLSLCSSLTLV